MCISLCGAAKLAKQKGNTVGLQNCSKVKVCIPVCRLFLMDLEHTDNNFTDWSRFELSADFLWALAVLKQTSDNRKCVRKTNDTCVFQRQGSARRIPRLSLLSCELYQLTWLEDKHSLSTTQLKWGSWQRGQWNCSVQMQQLFQCWDSLDVDCWVCYSSKGLKPADGLRVCSTRVLCSEGLCWVDLCRRARPLHTPSPGSTGSMS